VNETVVWVGQSCSLIYMQLSSVLNHFVTLQKTSNSYRTDAITGTKWNVIL